MNSSVLRWTSPFFAALLLSAASTLLPGTASGQEVAIVHCQGSCPRYGSVLTANNSKVVIHHLYAAGLNRYNRRPDWVAYRLSGDAIGIASLLSREWQPDRLASLSELADLEELNPEQTLPDVSRAASDYGGVPEPVSNEQNRVRLVPLTGYANTPYWPELNNTSNMLPMPSPLRLGAWLRLEQALNSLAKQQEEVYVVTGPLYYNGTAPGSDALVPGANLAGYFKVAVTDSGVAAFVFPHNLRQHESFCDRQAGVYEIERLTGLELFPDRYLKQSGQLLEALGCSYTDSP